MWMSQIKAAVVGRKLRACASAVVSGLLALDFCLFDGITKAAQGIKRRKELGSFCAWHGRMTDSERIRLFMCRTALFEDFLISKTGWLFFCAHRIPPICGRRDDTGYGSGLSLMSANLRIALDGGRTFQ